MLKLFLQNLNTRNKDHNEDKRQITANRIGQFADNEKLQGAEKT